MPCHQLSAVRLVDDFMGLDLIEHDSPMPFTEFEIIDNKIAVVLHQPVDLLEKIDRWLKNHDIGTEQKSMLKDYQGRFDEEDNMLVFIYYLKS